jgi:hypothetical protein
MPVTRLPQDSCEDLRALADEVQAGRSGQEALDSALYRFRAARWPLRQLAEALGISHEAARKYAGRSDGSIDPGFPVPERKPPATVLEPAAVPAEITSAIMDRLEAAAAEPEVSESKQLAPAVQSFQAVLAAAVDAGWDYHSLAAATGIHPRAVIKFCAQHRRSGAAGEAPAFPRNEDPATSESAWNARYPEVPPVRVPSAETSVLHSEDVSAAYIRTLSRWYLLGASREELERATGQQWDTVRKRLSRFGYIR